MTKVSTLFSNTYDIFLLSYARPIQRVVRTSIESEEVQRGNSRMDILTKEYFVEDVIREIANKLGVGIEQVYDMVPAFGQMVAIKYSTVLILLILVVVMFWISAKKKDSYKN